MLDSQGNSSRRTGATPGPARWSAAGPFAASTVRHHGWPSAARVDLVQWSWSRQRNKWPTSRNSTDSPSPREDTSGLAMCTNWLPSRAHTPVTPPVMALRPGCARILEFPRLGLRTRRHPFAHKTDQHGEQATAPSAEPECAGATGRRCERPPVHCSRPGRQCRSGEPISADTGNTM